MVESVDGGGTENTEMTEGGGGGDLLDHQQT